MRALGWIFAILTIAQASLAAQPRAQANQAPLAQAQAQAQASQAAQQTAPTSQPAQVQAAQQTAQSNPGFGAESIRHFRLESMQSNTPAHFARLSKEDQQLLNHKFRKVLLPAAEAIAKQAEPDDREPRLAPSAGDTSTPDVTTSTDVVRPTSLSTEEQYRNLINPDYVVQSEPFILPTQPGDTSFLRDLGSAVLGSAARLTANKTNIAADPLAATDPTAASRTAIRGTFRTSGNERVQVGCLVSMDESTLCILRVHFGHMLKAPQTLPVYDGMSRGIR